MDDQVLEIDGVLSQHALDWHSIWCWGQYSLPVPMSESSRSLDSAQSKCLYKHFQAIMLAPPSLLSSRGIICPCHSSGLRAAHVISRDRITSSTTGPQHSILSLGAISTRTDVLSCGYRTPPHGVSRGVESVTAQSPHDLRASPICATALRTARPGSQQILTLAHEALGIIA